jgi:Uma2 family endonuclease
MAGVTSSKRPWTASDLLEAGSRLEHYELWDGRLLVREPAGGWSGPVGVALSARLHAHVRAGRLGWVTDANTGFLLRREPDRVLSPDVAFVSRRRLSTFPRRGFVPVAPDLVVEIRSPTDAWVGVVEKCGIWIAEGVEVAWAVDPDRRRACVFRPAVEVAELAEGERLSAAPVLPGFSVTLADLLSDLGE